MLPQLYSTHRLASGEIIYMKLFGQIKDISSREKKNLERLYRKRCLPTDIITNEIARALASISFRLKREIGLLIDRKGMVRFVLCGSRDGILIPDLSSLRRGHGRLKGLRLVHTHLIKEKGLDAEDITDLALLRLDAMLAVDVRDGLPKRAHLAYLLPPNPRADKWHIETFGHVNEIPILFNEFIAGLEDEMQRAFGAKEVGYEERAILIHASPMPKKERERHLEELEMLSKSAGVRVVAKINQAVRRYHAGHLIGIGKLKHILIEGLYLGATIAIFDQNLSPVQVNNISELVDLKVIDRAQLILDIFAKRAKSREGKIQVELAQLKYTLPRLIGKGTAMSRLTGGIGGRGPGEKKLEIDRRRVKQKINSLEKELLKIAKRRFERRKRRIQGNTFKISLVGYTNAGKSTLMNRLTAANVLMEDKVFATLDPTSKRLFLAEDAGTTGNQRPNNQCPNNRCQNVNVIISDTVGFIRNMPSDLKTAFKSTLEELEDADLLLHIVDMAVNSWEQDMEAVEGILSDMGLDSIVLVRCFNKIDTISAQDLSKLPEDGIRLSAVTGEGIDELIEKIRSLLPAYSINDT